MSNQKDLEKKVGRIGSGSFMGGIVGSSPIGAAASSIALKKIRNKSHDYENLADIAPHIAAGGVAGGAVGGAIGYGYHKLRQKLANKGK
jgi:hypothetical protein